MEDGSIAGHDLRNTSTPLFSGKAHVKTASTITFSPGVKGLMATCSLDNHVKIWDAHTISNGSPTLVASKHLKAGKLNCG